MAALTEPMPTNCGAGHEGARPVRRLDRAHADELVELLHDLLHADVLAFLVADYVPPYQQVLLLLVLVAVEVHYPAVLPGYACVEHVAHGPGVAEGVGAREIHALEVLVYLGLALLVELQPVLLDHVHEDGLELLAVVVLEVYLALEAGVETGVRAQEGGHLAGVAGDDADEIPDPVLEEGEQRVDGLLPVLVVVALL